jgi:hypothetical protein
MGNEAGEEGQHIVIVVGKEEVLQLQFALAVGDEAVGMI